LFEEALHAFAVIGFQRVFGSKRCACAKKAGQRRARHDLHEFRRLVPHGSPRSRGFVSISTPL